LISLNSAPDIVSLADNMGMEVVAEGVETLSQLTQLRKLNCQYGQGYLFSRPVAAESVTDWISRMPQWQIDLFPALMTRNDPRAAHQGHLQNLLPEKRPDEVKKCFNSG
jgi:predicted signal transduction protein with EAL and GGDEF domain